MCMCISIIVRLQQYYVVVESVCMYVYTLSTFNVAMFIDIYTPCLF